MAGYIIRKSTLEDLESLNILVSAHKKELGFVRKVTLADSITQHNIFVAEIDEKIAGFVHYRHRRDEQTTLYDIAIASEYRLLGIGEALIHNLIAEAQALSKHIILLKCPAELPANAFYAHLGFEQLREEPGKQRKLVVWKLAL